jgi:hypothetical protein
VGASEPMLVASSSSTVCKKQARRCSTEDESGTNEVTNYTSLLPATWRLFCIGEQRHATFSTERIMSSFSEPLYTAATRCSMIRSFNAEFWPF